MPKHVIDLDTRGNQRANILAYKESKCDTDFWNQNIVHNPKIEMIHCPFAQQCGMDIKMYVSRQRLRRGLNQYFKEAGLTGVNQACEDGIFKSNNGAASLLTIDTLTGLTDWIVTGKAYIVCDDGKYPLSRGQVWGLVEMVHCALEQIYDFKPENMKRGKGILDQWAEEYKKKQWIPPSGTGGVEIYRKKTP